MKRVLLFVVISLFITLNFTTISAEEINLADYFYTTKASASVGSSWTYTYLYPAEDELNPPGIKEFTVNVTEEPSGTDECNLRAGDWIEHHISDPDIIWFIYHQKDDEIFWCEFKGQIIDPPLLLSQNHELDCYESCTTYPNFNKKWYLRRIPEMTVPAGTFYDVVVFFDIDESKECNPQSANFIFGLDPVEVPCNVTGVVWMARDIGLIAAVDIDTTTGNLGFRYELKNTNLPIPPPKSVADFDKDGDVDGDDLNVFAGEYGFIGPP